MGSPRGLSIMTGFSGGYTWRRGTIYKGGGWGAIHSGLNTDIPSWSKSAIL